jgi:VWFA-related protein
MSSRTGAPHSFLCTLPVFLWSACFAFFALPSAGARQSSGSSGGSSQATQTSSPAPPKTASASDAVEMNTRDSTIPLQSHVNVVPLRVVVRDAKGNPVTGLRKEDFQLFEDGKLQDISHFAIESPAPVPASVSETVVKPDGGPAGTGASANFVPPSRFVALLFDDVHITTQDLMRTRQAATRFIDSSVQPADRVAVFTISGQSQMDFTADRDKLRAALRGLMVRPVTGGSTTAKNQCPPIDYYQANLIVNNLDPRALNVATEDTLACGFNTDTSTPQEREQVLQAAQTMAESTANQVYEAGIMQTDFSLRRLEEVLRRLSVLPGQRVIVLLSPGFIYPEREYELSRLIDSANRANVFINTLDARGLYTPDLDDDTSESVSTEPTISGTRLMFRDEAQSADADVLTTLADGTGGFAFHNNNDLIGGLGMIAAAPEVSYLLAFTPRNFKLDGKFHSLKVTLATKQHVTIQTRRGFYAPKHSVTVEEAAKQEIQEALFSQDVQQEVPIQLHTQYYKVDATDAKLAVMTHVDLAHLHFEKAAGRNDENLTIVTALFDRDGNIVTGIEKTVEMRLLDATLARLSRTGLIVKASFDIKPGDYVVRLVVRDSNAAQLSTENGAVEIPY